MKKNQHKIFQRYRKADLSKIISVPRRERIQWSGIWLLYDAASFGLSASEPQQPCRQPSRPRGRRPPRKAAADTEGWSRTSLQRITINQPQSKKIHE